jgi:hypothetical protein
MKKLIAKASGDVISATSTKWHEGGLSVDVSQDVFLDKDRLWMSGYVDEFVCKIGNKFQTDKYRIHTNLGAKTDIVLKIMFGCNDNMLCIPDVCFYFVSTVRETDTEYEGYAYRLEFSDDDGYLDDRHTALNDIVTIKKYSHKDGIEGFRAVLSSEFRELVADMLVAALEFNDMAKAENNKGTVSAILSNYKAARIAAESLNLSIDSESLFMAACSMTKTH